MFKGHESMSHLHESYGTGVLSGTFGVVEIKSDISIHKDVTRLFLI